MNQNKTAISEQNTAASQPTEHDLPPVDDDMAGMPDEYDAAPAEYAEFTEEFLPPPAVTLGEAAFSARPPEPNYGDLPKGLSMDSLRTPPHSVEGEQSLLGSLLLDNSAWDRVADIITADDFYRLEHKLTFEHIQRLIDKTRPADVITVYESLKSSGKAEEVGGIPYLNTMSQSVPSAGNARRYAEIVRDKSILRQLSETADQIAGTCYQPMGKDTRTLLDEAESKIFKIAEQGQRGAQGFQHLPKIVTQVLDRLDELAHRDDASDVTGVPMGFDDLDGMTSGLQGGDLIIVAGRPSMGKTAFALNVAEYIGVDVGLPVLVFSMEMGASQLALRMLASIGGIDAQRLRTGRLQNEDWTRLTKAIGRLEKAPLYIDETPALSVTDLRSRARKQARITGQLGVIVVDYLQLMGSGNSGGNRPENRATEISEISRGLKALAKELDCPVVALSQLNRALEARPNKRPISSDLRESGAIEQDADVIMFIYRDEVYNEDSPDKGTAEIIVGKQRNGPTGTVRLTFRKELTKFENFSAGSGYVADSY